jgi:predicted MFS family arabinose efflux permease
VSQPSLWRDRDFRLVLGGQSISAFGDAITFTALPLMVAALTGSGVAMGTVGVLATLPDLIFGLPAGALADRWDRRRMIIGADLGRAALTALIPLSFLLGWPTMAVILLVTFPVNALRVLFQAAWFSMMPALVGRERVGQASGYAEAIFSLSFILGPAIAGLLVASIGPGPTLAIDAASFVVSAGAMTLVRRRLRAARSTAEVRLVADIADGLRYLAREPTLRVTIAFWSLVAIVTAPLVTAVVFLLTVERAVGSGAVGLILAGYGVGSFGGAIIGGRFTSGPLGAIMLAANVVAGATLAVFALVEVPLVQAVATLIAGGAGAFTVIPYVTLRATIPPDELLGRVSSTARTISVGLAPVGVFLGGIALDLVGGQATLLGIAAIGVSLSGIFAWSATLRRARVRRAPTPPVPIAAEVRT